MLFNLIRDLITILLIVLVVILQRKKIIKKKITFIVLIVVCFCIGTVITIFPIENVFCSFDCAESVFNYYVGKGEILDVIYGESSCMVVYSDSKMRNSYNNLIIPIKDNKYLIPNFYGKKEIYQNVYFCIYKESSTNDYYAYGYSFDNKPIEISDNKSSDFVRILANEFAIQDSEKIEHNFHCAYVKDFSEDYCVYVNGESYFINR